MKFKEIQIQPTNWHIDVFVTKDKKRLEEISETRYGLKGDPIGINECASIDSGKKSQLKGEKRIVICVESLKKRHIVVHELIHAMWHISAYIGYNLNYDSQEWQAVLFEYLYTEIFKQNYKEI